MSIQPGSGGGTSEASSLAALKSLHDTSASTLFSGVTPPGLINLGIGAPSDDCLPTGRVREAWHAAWGHPSAGEALAGSASSPDFLQYGPQLGHSAVVDALSGFLTRSYRETFRAMDGRPDFLPVEPSRLAVTAGASQSFFNLACLLLRKDAVVLMEDPTYFLAWASIGEVLGGFEAYGIRQRPGKGLDVNELERTLKGLASRPGAFKYDRESFDPAKDRFPYLLYSCATYNNPTGSTLGHEERRRIVELAYEYGVLVVCDDVYDMLHYDLPSSSSEPQPQRLFAYDTPGIAGEKGGGRILSNGSFSKLFGPGSRLGFVEGPLPLVRRLHASGLLASGGAPQQLLASLLIPLLSDGILEAHIKTVREVYGKRLRTVIQALEREGLRQFLLEPERWGGFFVFLRFPAPSEALEIRKRGMEKGVACSPGEWFSPLPTWPDGPKDDELIGGEAKNRCVRLAFTFYEESVLDQGIAKLGEVVRGLLKENGL